VHRHAGIQRALCSKLIDYAVCLRIREGDAELNDVSTSIGKGSGNLKGSAVAGVASTNISDKRGFIVFPEILKCDVDSITHVFGCSEISWIHEKENTESWIKGMIFSLRFYGCFMQGNKSKPPF